MVRRDRTADAELVDDFGRDRVDEPRLTPSYLEGALHCEGWVQPACNSLARAPFERHSRRVRYLGFALLLASCASAAVGPPPSAPASGPLPAPPQLLGSPFLLACQSSCERAQMARAVGADVIAASCRSRCAEEDRLPDVTSAGELEKLRGERARVRGVLSTRNRATLSLAGKVLPLAGPGISLEALAGLEGKEVRAVGVVAKSGDLSLDQVTTVAPTQP
ncbi:MAG: hypothetical protein HYV07_29710 [Deltaproteobacteria bacterium]|nr:hypothetical protein [Deltaproteobacteria bacterium]